MSDTVTLTNAITGQIYGTFAAAGTYLGGMFGDQYTTWLALTTDQQKQTLIAAARFIDRQVWIAAYDTFAERDALPSFVNASYELAALVADDASVIAVVDQGSNIQAVTAGGAGVTYFNPTSARYGSAPKLPPILMDLVGAYLATTAIGGPQGGSSSGACAPNPFANCSELERRNPWD